MFRKGKSILFIRTKENKLALLLAIYKCKTKNRIMGIGFPDCFCVLNGK
jgi:hypothetical protein